jgi:putative membrane protein
MNFLLASLLGLLLGFICGVIPGLHPNLLGAILMASFVDNSLVFVMVIMLVSFRFFDFLRAVFLFVPDESNVLAMHPIFQYSQKGLGLFALKLCLTGAVVAIMVGVIISPVLVKAVPIAFSYFRPYVPFALIILSGFLIIRDKKPLAALGIFLSAGLLGYFGLNSLNQPLLVLLTGFFGFPILLQVRRSMIKQNVETKLSIGRASIAKAVGAGLISSFLLTFVPAVGPSQASLMTKGLLKRSKEFLISIGAIAGFDVVFSSILLFSVGKARIGVLEMLGSAFNFDLRMLILVLLLSLATAIVSYLLAFRIGKFFIAISGRINYRILSIAVIIFICCLVFYFDSLLGLGVLAAASLIGIAANKLRTNLSHCMGSLVIPTLGYYFI